MDRAILKLTGYAGRSVECQYGGPSKKVRLAGQMEFREVNLDFRLPESTVVTLLLLIIMENEDLDERTSAIDPDAESTSDSGSWKYTEGGLVLRPRGDGQSYIRVGSFHHLYGDGFDKPLFTGNPDEECQVLLY